MQLLVGNFYIHLLGFTALTLTFTGTLSAYCGLLNLCEVVLFLGGEVIVFGPCNLRGVYIYHSALPREV